MGISISNATSSAITKYSVSLRSGEPDWSMIPSAGTVSYTHLDVYKRQAQSSIRDTNMEILQFHVRNCQYWKSLFILMCDT